MSVNTEVAIPSAPATDRTVRKRVSRLKPSPENRELYSPIDTDDPEFVKFADAIKRNGPDAPLVITEDNYIVSGHRRHAALTLHEVKQVRCRVIPHTRDSFTKDEYIVLLRDYNRNRHKSVAEQVRETMVDIDPEEAHARLRKLRDKSVYAMTYGGVQALEIEGSKTRHGISESKAEHVKHIRKVVFEDRKDYWPLTVRGIHYPLLNYDFIRGVHWPHQGEPGHGSPQERRYVNDDLSYGATSELLTRLRLDGTIPWEAITDGTRPLTEFRPFSDAKHFVRQEVEKLFSGYWRDLLQTQPNYVEVLVEKNTVYHMALSVTERYQIFTGSGRGFNSIDPYHELYERFTASGKERLILIVLSDFDPEGEQIPQVAGRTLRDDFGIPKGNLCIVKAGVTPEQIRDNHLQPMAFAKETSSNRDWFVDRNNGDESVYELEALDPAVMLDDLEAVIQSVLDMDLFNREAALEQEEAAYLEAARKGAARALQGLDL